MCVRVRAGSSACSKATIALKANSHPWSEEENGGFRGTMGHSLEGLGPRLPELWVRVTRRGVPSIDLNPPSLLSPLDVPPFSFPINPRKRYPSRNLMRGVV